MVEIVGGFCRTFGWVLVICCLCSAMTGVFADEGTIGMGVTHNCTVGGNPPHLCTNAGKCQDPQLGQWDCFCGVIGPLGQKSCYSGCLAIGTAC